jgi:hypothetical protein
LCARYATQHRYIGLSYDSSTSQRADSSIQRIALVRTQAVHGVLFAQSNAAHAPYVHCLADNDHPCQLNP